MRRRFWFFCSLFTLHSSFFTAPAPLAAQEPPAHFHHVHLNTTDQSAAMNYYVRNFRAVTVILAGLGVGVRTEKSFLLFDSVDDPPPAEIESAVWHIGWGSSNVERCYEEAQAKGLRVHTPLTPLGPAFQYAYLVGPDGVLIEINTHSEDRFAHVHLLSADPTAAGEWYVKHLGARQRAGAPPTFRGSPWATLMVNNVNLIIFPRPLGLHYEDPKYEKMKLVPTRGRVVDHLAFSYADLDRALERLEKEGVKILDRPAAKRSAVGARRAFLEGPDGMLIELVEDAGPDAARYWCPMDPEVRGSGPTKCPVCGMTLVPLTPEEFAVYPVDFETIPRALRPGQKGKLRFVVRNPAGGRVRSFEIVHEKLLHLFIVSHDLEYFEHVHPIEQPDGSFVLETTFPKPGHYQLFADFLPTGGPPQLAQKSFTTAGYRGRLAAAQLKPDTKLEKSDQGVRVTLRADELIAGKKELLRCYLTDEKSGAPVTDLERYLGAWGHALVLSSDLADTVHSHPAEDGSVPAGPGEVVFEAVFPRPGIYRLWTQFQRHGKVATVSFTLPVSRLK